MTAKRTVATPSSLMSFTRYHHRARGSREIGDETDEAREADEKSRQYLG